MATIVTRAGKGSPLTNAEVDANFTNLNSAKLEANQLITLSGDASGSGTTAIAVTLANSGVTAGTYTKVTVDAKGRVTTGASLLASDVPTLNQNTTGTASNVTGIVALANGGTGQSTKTAAFDALSPLTTLGDTIYFDGADNVRLAGNTTTTKQFLSQTGTGAASAAPAWAALASGDITTALGYTPYNSTNPNGYTSNTGTVTSVGLSLPALFSVTGSPVTTSGTLTASLASQTANTVFAAPNGVAGTPTFRALVAADIPALSYAPTAGSTSIVTLGTVTTGTWNASVISSTYGGTGVNNGGRTLTINTNSGTLSFTNLSTTLTIANTASVSGTNTGDQTITLTGDVTGSGTGSFATTLANSGVTAGTYTKVTVDAKGRVTTGASLASADVTTALGATPVYTTTTQTVDGIKTFRGAASTDAYMYLSAVNGIAVFQIAGSATNSAFLLFANSTNNERSRITVDNGRNLYISNNSGTTNHFTFDASGNFTATGNVTAYSDERLKKDWATLSADFVDRLAGVKHGTYTRIDTGERQAGASAQGVQELLPEVVMAAEDGTLSLAYGNAALVAAIQLAQQLVHTRNRVAQLEAKLARIAGEG